MKFHVFILFFLILPPIQAMGMRGSNLYDQFYFQPGMVRDYAYTFTTNSGFTEDYQLYVRMYDSDIYHATVDLTPYVTLNTYYMKGIPTGDMVPFTAHLKLPDKIDTWGLHEIRVGITETENQGGGAVGFRTATEARIIVIVLNPDEYAETSFSASNANVNDTMGFTFTVWNLGTPDLLAKGRVNIVDADTGLIVGVAWTPDTVIKPTVKQTIAAQFNTSGLTPGEYIAEANLRWGTKNQSTFNQTFLLGTKTATVTDYTREYVKDAINKATITAKSGWNGKLLNVYGIVNVLDKERKSVATFKTISGEIPPWGEASLLGYFDTTGLSYGEYPAKITLQFDGGSAFSEGNINITAGAATETVKEIPSDRKPVTPTYVYFLVAFIIVLLISFVIILAILLKKKQPA